MSKVAELRQFMFSKWRLAAILDFRRSEIWRHFCFGDVRFCLWTKFPMNVCNCDRVMASKVNIQNGGRRHLGFCRSEIWRQGKSRLNLIYLLAKFGEDILKGGRVMAIYVFKMAVGRRLGFLQTWNLKVFLFPGRRFFSLALPPIPSGTWGNLGETRGGVGKKWHSGEQKRQYLWNA